MYAYKIWGIYAPACCPADIIEQISDKFGENVSIDKEWKKEASPLHESEKSAPIKMRNRRVGTAYKWHAKEVA